MILHRLHTGRHHRAGCALRAIPGAKSSGFSLIELLMGVVVMSILVSIGMPSFQQWLRNAQVRNAAESIANGMQRARAEAVAHNANIQFAITGGSSWRVELPGTDPADPAIDAYDSREGASEVTVTALAADLATAATTVVFNNLGQPDSAAGSLRRVDLSATGASVPLRVTIGVGGNAKMCDPSLAVTVPPNPRAC